MQLFLEHFGSWIDAAEMVRMDAVEHKRTRCQLGEIPSLIDADDAVETWIPSSGE